jgi:hypothetical protein
MEADGKPDDHGEHAEPAELADEVADALIVGKDTPLLEEQGPIAFVAIDERKDESAGVGHVGANVEKILAEPEKREGEAVSLAMKEEEGGAQERNDEFAESAAKKHHGVAEVTEERVAGFVDDEIGVVEEEETGGVVPGVEKKKEIEREDDDATSARDVGPVVGAVEGELHSMSVAGARRRFREE